MEKRNVWHELITKITKFTYMNGYEENQILEHRRIDSFALCKAFAVPVNIYYLH